MQPRFVDVSAPSTGSTSDIISLSAPREETGTTSGYPVVPSTDILFPEFAHLKPLGRGRFGMVVKADYRGSTVAVKLLETANEHIHDEVCLWVN